MARIDRVKEELGFLKVLFGVFIAAALSLVVWLVQHRDAEGSLLIAALLGVAFCVVGIVFIGWASHRRFSELERL